MLEDGLDANYFLNDFRYYTSIFDQSWFSKINKNIQSQMLKRN